MFSASQLSQATIFGLGIMPYISASIIFQLLASVYPPLEKLQKEGESGRKKINEYTRYATVVLCLGQSWFYVRVLISQGWIFRSIPGPTMRLSFGWQLTAVLTMTAGTVFLMWLGEQIDEYGIGNGISLLIMAGILARMPQAGCELLAPVLKGGMELGGAQPRASRRRDSAGAGRALRGGGRRRGVHHPGPAPHPHPKRQARPRPPRLRRHPPVSAAAGQPGRRDADHLRQQLAAVPPGASSSNMAQCHPDILDSHSPGVPPRQTSLHITCSTSLLIYFFCYFWTAITFNPKDMSDNLKNYGTFIPGYRPGRRTADYLEKVMVRITYVGAGFLAVVAIVPDLIMSTLPDWAINYTVASFYGGTRPADRRQRGLRPGAEDRQPPGDAELPRPAGKRLNNFGH